MKNSIYLLIVAVVFLCSCKGNSYMKQRYTHFGHGPKKSVNHDVATRHTSPAEVQQAAPSVAVEESAAPTSVVVETSSAPTEQVATPKEGSRSISLKQAKQLVTGAVKNAASKASFNKKKDASDALQSHRGLLSGLIGLILYIVISAVVIAAIIILVLLII